MRAHLSKRTVSKLSKKRKERRISDARLWTETWSEDAQMWFYHNAATGKGEAVLAEPLGQGRFCHDRERGKGEMAGGETFCLVLFHCFS